MAAVWTKQMVAECLALGEDSLVEFKEARFKGRRVEAPRRDSLADELAALGNTLGGTLILSVSDQGEIQPLDRRRLDRLEQFVSEVCADSVHPSLPFITQRVALPEGPVLVVEVDQSDQVHRSPGGYFRRRGSSKRELSPEALHRLFQQRGRSGLRGPDEMLVDGTGPRTLDPDLSARFLSSRSDEPPESQLAKLGVLSLDGAGALRATVAGVLLCTKGPHEHIRGAVIEAVRYRGTELGRAEQHDAATITGPLDQQIREAVRFSRRNTRVSARRTPGFVEMPAFSTRAVFEAVVNAVVHRDYTMERSKTRFFIFDDRIEVYSPGTLPNTLSVEAMQRRQVTRNETVASMLRLLAIGNVPGAGDRRYFLQERGEGVPIIYGETRSLTGRDPTYELPGGAELCLTIPAAPAPVEGITGSITVTAHGRPLRNAKVVAHYPDGTWMAEQTDSFGRAGFGFHSELPITVFCASPGFGGHVEEGWRPPRELSIELAELPDGGSDVFTERTGYLPGLAGRLNPILDTLDRTYLYTTNVSIDRGKPQPVQFRLGQPLLLTDVNGYRLRVRFIEMIGKSSLVEYQHPE